MCLRAKRHQWPCDQYSRRISPAEWGHLCMRNIAITAAWLLASALASLAADPAAVRSITLEELARSLPRDPINVVFDVDDTVLFTSPGFQWGSRTYGPDIVSAGVSVRE